MTPCAVLVLDDDPGSVQIVLGALEGTEYQVCGCAHETAQAEALGRRHKPRAVIVNADLATGDPVAAASALAAEHGCAVLFTAADCSGLERRPDVAAELCLERPLRPDALRFALDLAVKSSGSRLPARLPPGLRRL